MASVAVLMAEGYEESETVLIVDILRRANITCHTFSFQEEFVKGMHGIYIKADAKVSDKIKEYDMLVLPGGRPGGANLAQNKFVLELVTYFNSRKKYLAAMCSGTVVLEIAKVIEGRSVTGYTGYEEKLTTGVFSNEVVVVSENLITSQGPATVYPFAYKLVELLGQDAQILKEKMLYDLAKGK